MPGALRTSTETHCPYCALQCGMTLLSQAGQVEVSARDFPTNRGGLCRKGWSAAELLVAPDRLTAPLLRPSRSEPLRPVSWEHAIEHVAARLSQLQARHGTDAVGIFGGGGLTNEKAYALGKFARVVLRSRHIDYNGRFCMAAAAVANQKAFGIDRGLPFPVADLARAELIVLAGGNPADTMPPLMQYMDEQRERGGKLLVIDPRRSASAERATLHLQLTPGTDAALANALLHVAIRDKLIDEDFIAARTRGFEAVKRAVAFYWPDRAERITGVRASLLVEAAHLLGSAASVIALTARGAEQQEQGVNNVLAYINLVLALGQVGKPYSGYGCLTGQGNGQGGREHGQKCDQLPGYRKLDDREHRAHVARVWGVAAEDLPQPGLPACEMFESIGAPDGLHALIVMGANPVVSAPASSQLRARLARLELLVVADIFPSETAELADVVLPVCQWAEEEGTMTNLEGRLLYRRRALSPPQEVRSDLQVLKLIATALGRGELVPDGPEACFEELRRASAGGPADYAGFSYARLARGEELFWPCPDTAHPGTPRLFADAFATPDGLARFHAVEHATASEEIDDDYPLYLTTGRLLSHYQSGVQTRRSPTLLRAEPEPFLELHPQTASSHGIARDDWVQVETRRGRALFKARLTPSLRFDTLFAPFHWGGPSCANELTRTTVEPISKIPAFKLSAARIRRAEARELVGLVQPEPTQQRAARASTETPR